MSSDKEIILFHYHTSPFARRVVWYLQFRQIPYTQCIQPMILPRPDVGALGIQYRRIPLLSIGRTVYLDTRCIIQALERLFPASAQHPALISNDPNALAISKLLSKWTIESPVFMRASQLIPTSMPILNDPKFIKDREQMTGRPWNKANVERMRPEALVDIKAAFGLLENTILSDGRDWVLGGKEPSLADIESVWPFVWLVVMKVALDASYISEKQFPKAFAWIARFLIAAKEAGTKMGKVKSLKGPEAVEAISNSSWVEDLSAVATAGGGEDPSGLKPGQMVQVWPTDSGFNDRDVGKLAALSELEIVWTTKTKDGKEISVHAPRQGFRIRAMKEAEKL